MNKSRILVVEDEIIVARDIQQQLLELGYAPLGVLRKAEEALRQFDQLRPDLVLMDIHLQGTIDGITAAQTIRERYGIPVVFLTAYASESVLSRAKLAEPYGYIIKPFDERELRTVVEIALYKHGAEMRQRESNAELKAILGAAWDGYWVVDMTGRILEVNDASCRMYGYTREEMLCRTLADFEVDENTAEIQQQIQGVLRVGSGRFERRHRCKDGSLREVEISTSYRPVHGGRFIAFLHDITARKRADAILQARLRLGEFSLTCSSEKLLQRMLDEAEALTHSAIGYVRLVETDQRTVKLRAWSSQTPEPIWTAVGRKSLDPTDLTNAWVNCLRERAPVVQNEGPTPPFEVGELTGPIAIRRILVAPVIRGGAVVALVGVANKAVSYNAADVEVVESLANFCWDIVVQKRTEEARKQGEANIEALLNAATESVFLIDRAGTILVANDVAARRLGSNRAAMAGACVYDFFPPDIGASRRALAEQVFTSGSPLRFVDQYAGRWFDQNLVPVRDELGVVASIAVFVADVTEARQAAEVVQANERRLNRIFHAAPIGIGLAKGRVITDVNDLVCRITGYERDEIIRRGARLFYATDDEYQKVGRVLAQMLESGVGQRTETRWRRKDGALIDVELNVAALETGQPSPAMVFSVSDVTARNRNAEDLRRSESRLRQAQKILGLGVWDWEIASDKTTWSGAMFEIYGIAPETFTGRGRDYLAFTHPEDRPRQLANIEEALKHAAVGSVAHSLPPNQFRIVRPDGSIRWVEGDAEVVLNQNHEPVAMIGTLVDITARKQAEETLRASEERFRLLFNKSDDAIGLYHLGPDGTPGQFLEVNDVACERYGYSRAEFLGLSPLDLNHAGLGRVMAWGADLHKEGRLLVEAQHVTKAGRVFPVEISAHRFELDGRPAVLSVGRDITARKVLEAQFRHAQKMEVIGQLAGGVAHDFNNILTAMMLSLELLRDAHPPVADSPLHELGAMTKRAAKLTQQLLMFARRQALQTTTFELNGALASLAQMLRRLLGERVVVKLVFDAPAAWVDADAGMIDQAVMNLCINARDAMPQGGELTLSTELVELDASSAGAIPEGRPGSFVRLRISDTGCGMSPEVLQHLFEPFFTTKEVGRGTGLGLASVHGIVHQHRGWINVESVVGQGSTFLVYLPASTKAPTIANVAKPNELRYEGDEKILLVEDDEIVRKISSSLLRKLGYTVFAAANGPEALQRWREHGGEIDLLLTDVVMPGEISGLELGEQLQRSNPDLKLVLMSGYSVEMVRNTAPVPANVKFLSKPFESGRLAAIIRQSLDGPSDRPG